MDSSRCELKAGRDTQYTDNKLKIQRHLSIMTGEVNQIEQCLVRDAVTGLVQGDDVEVIKAWILVHILGIPLTRCVITRNLFNLCESRLSHQQNE